MQKLPVIILVLLVLFIVVALGFQFGLGQKVGALFGGDQAPMWGGWLKTLLTGGGVLLAGVIIFALLKNRRGVASFFGNLSSLTLTFVFGTIAVLTILFNSYLLFIPSAWAVVWCLRYRSFESAGLLNLENPDDEEQVEQWKTNKRRMLLPKLSTAVLGFWGILVLAAIKKILEVN